MDYTGIQQVFARQYYRWRRVIPKRWLYHPDHFVVRELLDARPEVRGHCAELRLRHILSTALAYVPFYRDTVRIPASDLAHAPLEALLERFPYIDKETVMERQSAFLDERVDPRFLLYATSNGSTGTGIGVWRSKRESDIEKAFYCHAWGRLGFDVDKSRYLRIGYDAAQPLDAPPTWRQGNRLMLSPDHIQQEHLDAILRAVRRFAPRYIHAYPCAALALAELIAAGGHAIDWPLRGVLLASEPASPGQLARIGRVFGTQVSISYGLTERTNLAFALHTDGWTSPYRFEPLYGKTETLARDGRTEIVGTSLWNEVMPLIRYRTADCAALDAEGRCTAIEGRLQEYVLDRHGNRLPGLMIALDASTWDFIKTCQLHQREPGRVTLRIVPRRPLVPAEHAALLAGPRRHWGMAMEFDCIEVADIPATPGGKRRFVVNELPGAADQDGRP
jgi:phenylacetate-CoA ligase